MMKTEIRKDPSWGRILWMTDDVVEVGAALDFGIRIVHMSVCGMENLCYRQDDDLHDGVCTPQGWRLYGGHRYWLTPESELSYFPDNDPIDYQIGDNKVTLTQNDPWLRIRKQIVLTFRGNGEVEIKHVAVNTGTEPCDHALWGVNTLDGGGIAKIPFGGTAGGYTPDRALALWGETSPADVRISFEKDMITARHFPLKDYFKIGVYNNQGRVDFSNKGQHLVLRFGTEGAEKYADFGCNFELFMNPEIMELETLGVIEHILPGQSAEHVETWLLSKE